nr:small proline-rich protein 4 [Camelus dromedarius]
MEVQRFQVAQGCAWQESGGRGDGENPSHGVCAQASSRLSCPAATSSQWQEQRRRPPQTAQQQQVKQPCQPPPVKCQETCAPQTKNPCAPKAKKQCPPKGAAIPAQPKCPSAQQAPKSKQK